MNAEWNANRTAEMSEEQNLRNVCRQLEQGYVDWSRRATVGGYAVCQEWPAIGELGRGGVSGVRVRFLTTRNRSIKVQTPTRETVGEFQMLPGLAEQLYLAAGQVIDA